MENTSIEQKKKIDIEIEKGIIFRDELTKQKNISVEEIKDLKNKIDILNQSIIEKEAITSDISRLSLQRNDLIKINTSISDSILSKEQIDEREEFRKEIGSLKTEKQNLQKYLSEVAISKTTIINEINYLNGKLDEIKEKEHIYNNHISSNILILEKEKSRLESTISLLEINIFSLEDKKNKILKDIEIMTKVYSDVFEKVGTLLNVTDHVKNVNSSNIIEIENVLSLVKEKSNEIIKLSTEDIQIQKNILSEIPKLFVELQRKVLKRDKI